VRLDPVKAGQGRRMVLPFRVKHLQPRGKTRVLGGTLAFAQQGDRLIIHADQGQHIRALRDRHLVSRAQGHRLPRRRERFVVTVGHLQDDRMLHVNPRAFAVQVECLVDVAERGLEIAVQCVQPSQHR